MHVKCRLNSEPSEPVGLIEGLLSRESGVAVATPRAMPVEQTELPSQPSVLEASLKAMAEAVTQQTMLLQKVLEKGEQRPAKKGCFKCGGPHMQRDCPQNGKQQTANTPTAAGNEGGPAQV